MEFISDLLDIDNDIYGIVKVLIAIIGFLGITNKLNNLFSDFTERQNLKVNCEILNSLKNSNLSNKIFLEEKINKNLELMYNEKKFKKRTLFTYIINFTIFILFGLWSINIFKSSESFNPWIILTVLVSVHGLAAIFSGNFYEREDKGTFYRIEFKNKSDFILTLVFFFTSLISTLIFFYTSGGFNLWSIALSLLTVILLWSITSYIDLKKY